jgi:hypothetical protein
MLIAELRKKPYNKTTSRKKLLSLLNQRKAQAVEFKHANISAVLQDLGLPFLQGYKPRGHYQAALRVEVLRQLDDNDELRRLISLAQNRPPTTQSDLTYTSLEKPLVREPYPHALW